MDRRLKEVNSKSYIATSGFPTAIKKYTVTTGPSPQFVKTGTLSHVDGATFITCPAGRILRENGKKLYPGVNPGVDIFYVGVFDSVSLLSGYIDPNSRYFAPFSGEKPLYIPDTYVHNLPALGSPTFTAGVVYASDEIVSINGQVRSNTVTTLVEDTPGVVNIDITRGQVFILNMTGPVTLYSTVAIDAGSTVYLKVISSGTGPLTFGTDIIGLGPLTTVSGKIYMLSFICDGQYLCEVSRTPAYVDVV